MTEPRMKRSSKHSLFLWVIHGVAILGMLLLLFLVLRSPSSEIRVLDKVDVIDGDVFHFVKSSFALALNKVRLLGVDAPEKEDEFYQEATDFLKTILNEEKEQPYWIQVSEQQDKSLHGKRALALVYLERGQEKSVNEMILEAGWGKIYKFPGSFKDDEILRKNLFDAQISAAQEGLGIWQNKQGIFVGGILYWGDTEIVALVNRGKIPVQLSELILRDENLKETYEADPSNSYNLLDESSWEPSSPVILPGDVVYLEKPGGRTWRDDGELALLYDVRNNEIDRYSYKGPG